MSNSDKLEILEWFTGRCGDVINNSEWQRIFPEFARILGAGPHCLTCEDAVDFMEKLTTNQLSEVTQ